MTIALQNMNALPVRTWNRLHINDTAFEEVVPNVGPLAFPPEVVLPDGIHRLDGIPYGFPEMETSAGPHAASFVRQWANAGLALYAPQNKGARQPVVVQYHLGAAEPAVVDDNAILAEPDSQITLVQIYDCEDDDRAFHAGLTRVMAEAGSHVKLVQIQLMNDTSAHWNDVGVMADEGATVEVVQIDFGAKRALGGCKVQLLGANSKADIHTFYYGDGARSLDFNYVVRHVGAQTESEIAAGGVLFGRSEKTYRSTIEFVSGAARSVGHESENTLLFSPDCVNRSAPLILCG